ncbi:hypothetical protein ABW19_dt0202938 [Dactylella cylindrospora]|nr:hypothetical protein ABW19_dt0202938 [Dactylella cylindrospora]
MARETQTTRALREHAANLKAPSQRALRYLRSLIDPRPYTTLSVSHAGLQELEELRQMGLWPPQTCNGTRKAISVAIENMDVCGISKREEKAEKRVVPGLQGRQPELRLDYEDTSIIRRNQPRPVVESAPQTACHGISTIGSIQTDVRAENRFLHTAIRRSHPSPLLSQSAPASHSPAPKTAKQKNQWQFVLATAGRQRIEHLKKEPLTRLHVRRYTNPTDEANRELEARISEYLQRPAFPTRRAILRPRDQIRRTNDLRSHRQHHQIVSQFNADSAFHRRIPVRCIEMCVDAYIKLGKIALARAIMEKFKTKYQPSAEMMVLMLKTLLARCKVDIAIFFVQMAKDTATGFSSRLTKTLLEGVRSIGAEIGLLQKVFDFVESIVPESQQMHYTILIRGYIENKRLETATELLVKMKAAGHVPDKWTYNAILTGAAKHGKWEQIQPLLAVLKEKGFEVSTLSMNTILNFAAASRDRSIKNLYELTRSLAAPWDMATWNILLKATIMKCPDKDIEYQVKAFFRKMRNADVQPDEVTANTLLSKLKHSGDTRPHVLRRLLVGICDNNGLSSNHTKEFLRLNMLYNTSPQTTTTVVRKDGDTLTPEFIAHRMIAYMRELKPIEALKVFQDFIDKSIRPTTRILLLATKSVFLLPVKPFFPKNLLESKRDQLKHEHNRHRAFTIERILEISKEHGLDFHGSLTPNAWKFLSSVFKYRLSKTQHTESPKLLLTPDKEILFELYRFYHEHDLPNPHYPLMVTASTLFTHRQYEKVVDIMRSVAMSEWGVRRPFDIVSLTILLKAYVVLRDENGIKWIAQHIVERDLEPDDVFMKVIRREKKVPMASYTLEWDADALAVVEESRRMCEELQERIMEKRVRRKDLIVELLSNKGSQNGGESDEKQEQLVVA